MPDADRPRARRRDADGKRGLAPAGGRAEPGAGGRRSEPRALRRSEDTSFDPSAPVVRGTLRAPWRWERLIVDAAVIGGSDRWRRRLDGLEAGLETQAAGLEDPDDPRNRGIERRRRDLTHLRAFALPLLEALEALPRRATWGEWGTQLARLAERAIRKPARVLAVLRELAPMGPIGPVGLTEVTLVLSSRLSEMVSPPSGAPAGKLYVASIDGGARAQLRHRLRPRAGREGLPQAR